MSSKLIRGTFILTLGTFISKFLGLFYVIPFDDLLKGHEEGASLYQYGYVPYTIFLTVATAGVPLAVSKFVSKYNAIGEYAVGRKLFKSGLVLMTLTGIVSFLIMYAFAPIFAEMTIKSDEQVISVAQVTTVIRAVSFALIIIPFMSLIRGFFQGHQSMGPTAVSQVIEQIVRIVFLLGGIYVVLNILDGTVTTAISVATFAAFVGGLASLGALIWYWFRRKPHLDELSRRGPGERRDFVKSDVQRNHCLFDPLHFCWTRQSIVSTGGSDHVQYRHGGYRERESFRPRFCRIELLHA